MKFRGNISQQTLAEKMRNKGFKWSQATVWATEKGDRPVRLSEVIALSEVLDKTYDSFLLEEHDTDDAVMITQAYELLLRERSSIRTALKNWIVAKQGALAAAEIYGDAVDHLPKHAYQRRLKSELQEIDLMARQEHITDIYNEAEAIADIEVQEYFDEDGISDDYSE